MITSKEGEKMHKRIKWNKHLNPIRKERRKQMLANKQNSRIFILVFSLSVLVVLLSAKEVIKQDPKNNHGVNAMLERMERGFSIKNLEKVFYCLSDDAILVEPPERSLGLESQVLSGEQLRSAIKHSLTSPLMEGTELIAIDGTGGFTLRLNENIADMILTNAIRVSSVRGKPARIGFVERRFVVARYEEGIWKICYLFPCFVKSRVVVTEVTPGSQAELLGIEKGDIITHHLLMPIFDSDQLLWRAKMFYNDSPHKKFRVLVRRGNHLLPFHFGPGKMGIETQNFFEGQVDTITLAGKSVAEHPAFKIIKDYHNALKKADSTGIISAFCSKGFIFCYGLPSERTQSVITANNAVTKIPEELKMLEKHVNLETLNISGIRLIVYGNLALGGWRVSMLTKNGESACRDVVVCLCRNDGRWSIVGMPWQNQHMLGLN
jgi:hypothetical protein